MKLSAAGIAFLKHAEGFRSRIYSDAGKWAIGFGCQVDLEKYRNVRLTRAQAESLMRERLREFEAAVAEAVKFPLREHQRDAIIVFAYNVPPYQFKRSTLVKLLNQGKLQEAAEQFGRWVYSVDKDKPNAGLVERRKLERQIFLGESVAHYTKES